MNAVSTWIVTSETSPGGVPASEAIDLTTALVVAAGYASAAQSAEVAAAAIAASVASSASTATTAATTATTEAAIAVSNAGISTAAASTTTAAAATATTQAGIATTAATTATGAATTATTKADVATTAASTATTKADVATAAAATAVAAAGSMTASNTAPAMDGTASPGSTGAYARGDHVHPTDTSRAKAGANSDITSLSGLTTPLSVAQGGTGTTTGPATVPPGTLLSGPWTTAPAGYLKANGALVSRTTYAALFAAIGTTGGAGDGSTTFALPDYRGEFIRGLDDGRGIDTGRVLGSEQLDALQGHLHGVDATRTVTFWWQNGGSGNWPSSTGWGNIQNTTTGPSSVQPDGTNGTPRTAAETRPRNVAALICIKY